VERKPVARTWRKHLSQDLEAHTEEEAARSSKGTQPHEVPGIEKAKYQN